MNADVDKAMLIEAAVKDVATREGLSRTEIIAGLTDSLAMALADVDAEGREQYLSTISRYIRSLKLPKAGKVY